jgi:hypothetical protein
MITRAAHKVRNRFSPTQGSSSFWRRRLSGHQLFENGRSGYAEEEDHEQDCERTVSLEPIDGHEQE